MTAPSSAVTAGSAERIRRAAITLFAHRGFHGTGIRELAKEAGLSSASLYHHMGTKERLLAEIMETSLGRLCTAARQANADVAEPTERLSTLVALHVLTHAVRPEETRVVDNEVAALSTPAREAVVRMRDEYEALFAETITEGVRSGAFRAADPVLARLALLEMCNGVARWYSPHGEVDLATLAVRFARIALRVVEAEGPHHDPDIARCRDLVAEVWGR